MTYRTERSVPATSALLEGVAKHPALERIRDARQSVGVRGDELPCATNPHAYDGTDPGNARAAARACQPCPAREACYQYALDAVAAGVMARRDRAGQVYGGRVFGVPDICEACGGEYRRGYGCVACRSKPPVAPDRRELVMKAAGLLGLSYHAYRKRCGESRAVAEAIIAQHVKESAS